MCLYFIINYYICKLENTPKSLYKFRTVTAKEKFIELCDDLDRRYWRLKRRQRKIVGWCILLTFLALVTCGGYYCYKGGKALFQLCQSACNVITDGDEQEEVYASANDWSYKGSHRKFPVKEKDPKRHLQLAKDFNDINDTQLAAAIKLGITPIETRDDLEKVKSKLVELKDTKYYVVDELTHSVPYLVPDAADFLTALGELMQEYNGTHSRFIITSVLRTAKDVKRLSRGNVNASTNSCHCYGTTFDITYNRFDRLGITSDIQLKADLARALYDLRASGHCYVKYEYKQACFHVTVRPK